MNNSIKIKTAPSKFARLAYSTSWNLGDHIQTLATEQFLGEAPINIERNLLDKYEGEEVRLIMQGYFFIHNLQCAFPPSPNIRPIFYGFHIEDSIQTRQAYSTPEIISYFKENAPIGCRDRSTLNFLKGYGVDAYFSRCLTLTFPRRTVEQGDTIYFIDAPDWLLKESKWYGKKFNKLKDKAKFLTQVIDSNPTELNDDEKSKIARERLALLKSKAKIVITSRLHIAGPCLSMGIPVVLIPREATPVRYEAVEGLLPIYSTPTKRFIRFGRFSKFIRRLVQIIYIRFIIEWNPKAPNIEETKMQIIKKLEEQIKNI